MYLTLMMREEVLVFKNIGNESLHTSEGVSNIDIFIGSQ